MIHHLFIDGQVILIEEWRKTQHFPQGTYGYTPDDSLATWYTLDFPRWKPLSKSEMPKEFLAQLLLLGIPIKE